MTIKTLHPEYLAQSHLPKKLLHREEELQKLQACLNNSLNTFVYSESGIGKILLPFHGSLEELEGKLETEERIRLP